MNRTADMNVQEKWDCAVVAVNQPNNEGQLPSAEAGEGRAQTADHFRRKSYLVERKAEISATLSGSASSVVVTS